MQVRNYIGPTTSVFTISRVVGDSKIIADDPEKIAQVRNALGKASDRLSSREDILMRADTLRIDSADVWFVDRHMLIKGNPSLGRFRGAKIVASGDTSGVIHRFLELAGATWNDDLVDEDIAFALVEALKHTHRVEVFGLLKTLLRETDIKPACSKCGASTKVEFLPTFAAPSIPLNLPEFEKAVARMRRGPPLIFGRASPRAT
ncbi:MAG: hypothetical protein O3B95_08540 [Chloroflexi bacterium]|nr:hypothetical protein [Chloroflexota bacterium]